MIIKPNNDVSGLKGKLARKRETGDSMTAAVAASGQEGDVGQQQHTEEQ